MEARTALGHGSYVATPDASGSLLVHAAQGSLATLVSAVGALYFPVGHSSHHLSTLLGFCLLAGHGTQTVFVVCVPSHFRLGSKPVAQMVVL